MGAMSSIFSIKIKVGAHKHRNPEIPDEFIKAVLCSRFHHDDKIGLVSSLKGDRSKKGLTRARGVFCFPGTSQMAFSGKSTVRKIGRRPKRLNYPFESSLSTLRLSQIKLPHRS